MVTGDFQIILNFSWKNMGNWHVAYQMKAFHKENLLNVKKMTFGGVEKLKKIPTTRYFTVYFWVGCVWHFKLNCFELLTKFALWPPNENELEACFCCAQQLNQLTRWSLKKFHFDLLMTSNDLKMNSKSRNWPKGVCLAL